MNINCFGKTVVLALLLTLSSPVVASTDPPTRHENKDASVLALQTRLEEIRAINREELTKEERKALRREIKEIKKELAALRGGVYLSVGAILLIALLLILLL
jgi:hypothetical protein